LPRARIVSVFAANCVASSQAYSALWPKASRNLSALWESVNLGFEKKKETSSDNLSGMSRKDMNFQEKTCRYMEENDCVSDNI